MSVQIGPVIVRFAGFDAASASFGSVADVLGASNGALEGVAEGFADGLMLGDDIGDLVRIEPIGGPAVRASELKGFEILPGDRYLELVTALTGDGNAHVAGVRHGWPILSVGRVAAPTLAEGRGASSPLAGGPGA